MCHVLQVSRSGYYQWRRRTPGPRARRRAARAARIQEVWAAQQARDGSPKITAV